MKFLARAYCGSVWVRTADGRLILNTRHAEGRGDDEVYVVPLDQEARDAFLGWPGGDASRTTPRQRRLAKRLIGKARREAVNAMWGVAWVATIGRAKGYDGHTWVGSAEVSG